MPVITLELTDEEQVGLRSFIDVALKREGLNAIRAAVHWEQKIAQAQEVARAATLKDSTQE